jgi:hypothetical protein
MILHAPFEVCAGGCANIIDNVTTFAGDMVIIESAFGRVDRKSRWIIATAVSGRTVVLALRVSTEARIVRAEHGGCFERGKFAHAPPRIKHANSRGARAISASPKAATFRSCVLAVDSAMVASPSKKRFTFGESADTLGEEILAPGGSHPLGVVVFEAWRQAASALPWPVCAQLSNQATTSRG